MHSDIPTTIIRSDEPLAPYTSWRIGGVARQYYRPKTKQDLAEFLQTLPTTEPLLWLGLGSNVLISDAGFAGTVIHTAKMQSTLAQVDELTVMVDAGAACAKIAKFAAKHGLSGAEFFAGIPGTMGGALAMNAGAFGGETWRHVVEVETINRAGVIHKRLPGEYQIGYRSVKSAHSDEWFLAAKLKFTLANETVNNEIKVLLQRRNAAQPIGLFSCGSVFRNPDGKYAAELIEASKLKGRRIGGAEVSTKHANFIINVDNAQAIDVIMLIKEVQAQVLQDHGVLLQPEVRFVGFDEEPVCLEK